MEALKVSFLAIEALKPLHDLESIKTASITLSLLGYAAPAPAMVESFMSGNTAAVPRMFLIIMTLSGALWFSFGTLAGDDLTYAAGWLGMIFGATYIALYSWTTRQIKFPLVVYAMTFASSQFYLNYLTVQQAGTLGSTFTLLFFVAPLEKLRIGLETKNPKFFNPQIALVNFLKACCWVIYAILVTNPFLFYPNIVGILVTGLTLFSYVWANEYLPHNFPLIVIVKFLLGVKSVNKETVKATEKNAKASGKGSKKKKMKTN